MNTKAKMALATAAMHFISFSIWLYGGYLIPALLFAVAVILYIGLFANYLREGQS